MMREQGTDDRGQEDPRSVALTSYNLSESVAFQRYKKARAQALEVYNKAIIRAAADHGGELMQAHLACSEACRVVKERFVAEAHEKEKKDEKA